MNVHQPASALFQGTEGFEFRPADFPKLKIQKGAASLCLNVPEYFRYGISDRNFCLLGIILKVQSVKPPMTRAELAHTLYTPELSLIAKKLPVTILRRLSARNRHRLTSRARSSVGHNSAVDNSRDSSLTYNSSRAAHSRSGNSTRRSRDNRSSGRSYRKGTGTGAGYPNSLGLGPGLGREPRRR